MANIRLRLGRLRQEMTFKFARMLSGIGIHNFSRASLNGIDDVLAEYLDYDNGFFVEVGGFDGFTQSNTFYLEAARKWHGIIIEPVPRLAALARRRRPNAVVLQAAITADAESLAFVTVIDGELTSSVDSSLNLRGGEAHVRDSFAVKSGGLEPEAHTVCAIDFSKLSELIGYNEWDFLSLDVEGFEVEALKGLGCKVPRFILVETEDLDAVKSTLGGRYTMIRKIGSHDYLFRRAES